MTAFMLFDEIERSFESLEDHPERHAMAFTMYCLCGQRSAQAMLDGRITAGMIRKAFVAYPKAKVARALEDLVSLGLWERLEAGDYLHKDWDLTQFTAQQERARREQQAERQRRRRQRSKGEFENVTGDVPRDEARDVTPASASASAYSSASASANEGESARVRVGSPHGEESIEQRQERLERLVRVSVARRYEQARGYLWANSTHPAIGKLAAWLAANTQSPEADLETMLEAFFADAWAIEKTFPIGSLANRPDRYLKPPTPVRTPARRLALAPATTGADFENAEPFEAQMARLEALR